MSDSASDPEEEKPRYLLPKGCKDLIDAFPKAKPARKIMYVVDQAGNILKAAKEIPEQNSIPYGLIVLPGYISRLVTSANPSAWLLVFTADEQHGFGLARLDNETLILLSAPANGESELECRFRAFFARRSIEPVQDYLSNGDTVRHLAYSLPKSAAAITAICRELLTDCLKVQPNATLRFVHE